MALYTFSKSIDNASSFNGGGGTAVQYPLDLRAERGLSSRSAAPAYAELYAFLAGGHARLWRNGGWKTRMMTGWTLNGKFTATSGPPLTAHVSGNLAHDEGHRHRGHFRAQATGLDIDGGRLSVFQPAGVHHAARRRIRECRAQHHSGAGLISLTAALNRSFRFGDTRRQLQFRICANNALNHVQITRFGTTVNSATYGLATPASGTRTVVLNMRFGF